MMRPFAVATTKTNTLTILTLLFVYAFHGINAQECEILPDGSEVCSNSNDPVTGVTSSSIQDEIWWNEADLDETIDPTSLPSVVIGLPCQDDDKACPYFRSIGECMSNPHYMGMVCRVTCGSCEADDPTWPKIGNVGVPQIVPDHMGSEFKEEVLDIIRESRRYLHEEVLVEGGYLRFDEVRQDCTNHHELCSIWVHQDQCDENRPYMRENCRLACQLCKEHPKFLHGMHF